LSQVKRFDVLIDAVGVPADRYPLRLLIAARRAGSDLRKQIQARRSRRT